MKQKQYSPMNVAEMAVSLFIVDEGCLDDIELKRVSDFELACLEYMRADHADLMAKINDSGDYNDEIKSALIKAVETLKKQGAW